MESEVSPSQGYLEQLQAHLSEQIIVNLGICHPGSA